MSFDTPEAQEQFVREWAQKRTGLDCNFKVVFYPGRYAAEKGALQGAAGLAGVLSCCVCISTCSVGQVHAAAWATVAVCSSMHDGCLQSALSALGDAVVCSTGGLACIAFPHHRARC